MRFVTVLCLWLVAETAAKGAGSSSLSISSPEEHLVLPPGDTVTLPCLITGEGFSTWTNPIVWYKITETGDEVVMNTNAVLNEPFQSTNRYTIEPEITAEKIQLSLTIKNITVAENGTYRCVLKDAKSVIAEVTHSVQIPAPIDDLILTTNRSRQHHDGNDTHTYFDFEKLTPAYVSCVSKGGNPQPTLKMYRGRTDVTDEFDNSVIETRIGPKGLEEVKYEVQLVKADFMADSQYTGHNLKCVSKVPKLGKNDKNPVHKQTRVATMEVTYPPEIECTRDWAAFLETEQYAMECNVNANPQIELDSIYWRVGDQDNGTEISVGKTVDGISANLTVDRMTDKVKVSLTFDQINSTHFQNYILRVKNELGERHFHAVLSLATTTISTSTTSAPATVKVVHKVKEANPPYQQGAGEPAEISSAHLLSASLTLLVSLSFLSLTLHGSVSN